MRKFTFIIILFLLPVLGFNQSLGAGASAMYNFQSEGFGAGARVNFFPNRNLSIVPQFSYFFLGLSDIVVNEWTLGLGLEFKVYKGKMFNWYLLAHGGYNRWNNPGASNLEGAQATNWNLEGGAGITTNRCLRPFLEYRYNIKFQETHLQLGLLYIFGCSGRAGGYRNTERIRKMTVCPAYN